MMCSAHLPSMDYGSPNCPPICKGSWSLSIRLMIWSLTDSPRSRSDGNPRARQAWAVEQLRHGGQGLRNLGLKAHATFSGALAWPYVYPWPQRPAGLIETAFEELAARWLPILNAFDEVGVDLCFEIHPGEDLHDGATFEMFLDRVKNHPPLPHAV